MRKAVGILYLVVTMIVVSCGCSTDEVFRHSIDSLNAEAYRYRYRNVDSTTSISHRVLDALQSRKYADGRNVALLNLAFVAYQQMDFDGADSLLDVVEGSSRNQVLLLCADVLRMKCAQRTGDGVMFYEAMNDANSRLRRIGEGESLPEQDKMGLEYAQTELHIIASTYYYYQGQDSLSVEEIRQVAPLILSRQDTAQWMNYCYMLGSGGMIKDEYPDQVLLQEFDMLIKCSSESQRSGLIYFEANSLQALAEMLSDQDKLEYLSAHRPMEIQNLHNKHMSWTTDTDTTLALSLAHHSLHLFQTYDDMFQTACVWRTLGELHFELGQYEKAVEDYCSALDIVNAHHQRYYDDGMELLPRGEISDAPSVELLWVQDSTIQTLPEWIARIRQQMTLAYSALNDKEATDYNRNAYLDLLMATGQNFELESRTAKLQRETSVLFTRLILLLVVIVVIIILFFLMHRVTKRNTRRAMQSIKEKYEDEKETVEEELRVSMLKRDEDKRNNVERRAKVKLVQDIIPFIDRMVSEVQRISKQEKPEKFQLEYISELTSKIEEYNQILTEWIQVRQGKLSMNITTVNLQELFDIVREGHFAFDQKGVELEVSQVDAKVKADRALTLFMINTLADNARKFTPEGGKVSIYAESQDDYVEISVRDTGCGMSQEDADTIIYNKVYDPREIGKGSEDGKGFGFGLMNCRGIIEMYRKTSAIFSCCRFGLDTKQGEGSRFFIRLPRVATMILLCLMQISVHADEYALYDSVYQCNVEGRYHDAISYAEEALHEVKAIGPLQLIDTLSNGNDAKEIAAINRGEWADYELIVGLRNEIALSALAIRDWRLYEYNNRVCSRLHKLLNQDKTLPEYCRRLERTSRASRIMLWLLFGAVALLLIMITRFYLQTLRHRKKTSAEYINNAQEEISRMQDVYSKSEYERNRLYVQNQVLDNCLSSIKHETMYYPSRIRQLAERMEEEESADDVKQLTELVQYYRHIYAILSEQASTQIQQPGFKRTKLDAMTLHQQMVKEMKRSARKTFGNDAMVTDVSRLTPGTMMFADEVMLPFMCSMLVKCMAEMSSMATAFCVESQADDNFVRYTISVSGERKTEEELHTMFYPSRGKTDLLMVKQILREHDEYCNNPGLRLVAEATDDGYSIYFTLKKTKN